MSPQADDRRPTSWTARVLAPVFLVIVAAALVLVISDSLKGTDAKPGRKAGHQTTASNGCSGSAQAALKQGYYVVTAADVEGLSGIATKTCTDVDTLVQLNPNLDPQALQVNNCVDLKPDGCKALSQGG